MYCRLEQRYVVETMLETTLMKCDFLVIVVVVLWLFKWQEWGGIHHSQVWTRMVAGLITRKIAINIETWLWIRMETIVGLIPPHKDRWSWHDGSPHHWHSWILRSPRRHRRKQWQSRSTSSWLTWDIFYISLCWHWRPCGSYGNGCLCSAWQDPYPFRWCKGVLEQDHLPLWVIVGLVVVMCHLHSRHSSISTCALPQLICRWHHPHLAFCWLIIYLCALNKGVSFH